MKEQYRGVTQLFTTSTVLRPHPDSPLYLVQKLNDFEMEEARKGAAAWRASISMALHAEGGDELNALRDSVARMDRAALIPRLVEANYTKHAAEASNAIHADPTWNERMDILERVRREEADDDQRKVIDDINAAYLSSLSERISVLDEEERERLGSLTDDKLREAYVEAFIEQRAAASFIREMRYQEVFYGVRACVATRGDDGAGEWDHTNCKHEQIYDDIVEVRAEPDELLVQFTRAFDRLNVNVRSAKSSASRQPSSEPSRPPSAQEESVPSGPAETSPEPDGTSSSQSTTP